MSVTFNLKVFISISMGLHLLFLSIIAFLFPDFKLERLPNLNIEVSLLPLGAQERPISTPVPPARLKHEIKKEKKDVPQQESQEGPSYKKEPKPESPNAVQTVAANMVIEKPKPHSPAPIIQALSTPLPKDSGVGFEQESHLHSLTRGDIPQKENLTISVPQSKLSHGNPPPDTTPAEKPQDVVKLQPRSEGESLFVQPRYAQNPKPFYPQDARKRGYEGEVILRVEVLSDGRVGQIEVRKSSGYESLDHSALTTVKRWKFIPAKKGEEVVSLWVNIPIKFQLR
jgi:protein TonB